MLTWFNSSCLPGFPEPLRVVELFAGDGAVGRSCRFAHIATAMLDIRMGKCRKRVRRNAFDLTLDAGPAYLAILSIDFLFGLIFRDKKTFSHVASWKFRLAVWTILNTSPKDFFVLIACVCTSFSAINQGTAKRTPATPWGDCSRPHVNAP